jgi:hypothetical protein
MRGVIHGFAKVNAYDQVYGVTNVALVARQPVKCPHQPTSTAMLARFIADFNELKSYM